MQFYSAFVIVCHFAACCHRRRQYEHHCHCPCYLYGTGIVIRAIVVVVVVVVVVVPAAYLEQGIVVTDSLLLCRHYMGTWTFRVDVMSVLPTDALYAWLGTASTYVRLNRLLRLGRLAEFLRRAESRTKYPNALRVGSLGIIVVLAIHWNACVYYQLSAWIGLGSDDWVYTPSPGSSLADHYFFCVYWSTMLLLTIGEMDHPVLELECVFMTIDYLLGILIIATVVGGISETIAKTSAERDSFRHRLDSIKNYLSIRYVDDRLAL